MTIILTLLFVASAVGVLKPFAGLKRSYFGVAAVAFFGLIGVTTPNNDNPVVANSGAEKAAEQIAREVEVSSEDANLSSEAAEQEPRPVPSNWSYREQRDELRDSTTYLANILSENSHQFNFPYDGGKLSMTVRESPAYGLDVYWRIPEGQMTCDFRNCRGSISFDGSVESLTLNEASDGSSDIVFATYSAAILRKLRSAERVVVELEFYQEGSRQFIFETQGLEWDH